MATRSSLSHFNASRMALGLLLLLITSVGRAQTCDTQPSPYLSRALGQAAQALEEKQGQQALTILLKASQWVGEHSHHTLEFHLGVQLVQAGRTTDALLHFRRATELCDRFAPAWQNLGRTAFEAEQFNQAARALGRAYQMTGDTRTDLRYFQALALYRAEKWSDSVTLSLDLFRRFPQLGSADWAELAAAAATPGGRRTEVIEALSRQTPTLGGNPRFRRVLANLMLQEKRYHEAMIQLVDLDHLGAINDAELRILADLYRMQNLPLDAADSYRRLAERGKDSEALLRKQAESLMAGFRPLQALELLERGLERWDSERLWLLTGQLRFEAQRLEQARLAFERVLKHTPEQGHALMMIGYILFLQDKPAEALPWLEKAELQEGGQQAASLREYVNRLLRHRQQAVQSLPPAGDNA